jgi:hypothetical protein
MLGRGIVVVKINRPFVGMFAVLIFFLASWACWFSLSGYLAFFNLSDVVVFSWKVGVIIFGAPLLFYFSYLSLLCAVKNKIPKMNNKLANYLAVFVILGAVASLFLSMYVGQNLMNDGYKVCPRKSWMAPNEYVRNLKLCP